MRRTIPPADPGASYLAHKAEVDAAVMRVLASGWYIMGREVEEFERAFAAAVGTTECISTGSGTDALVLALRALDIGSGDTVVTVSHTAVASVTAIDLVGALPLLVDVDPKYMTMSPDDLERTLARWAGPPVKAVVPVHLYGQPADMDRIVPIARRFGAAVIEDCAQAHGAMYRGRRVGTIGDAAEFSFYPTKNLGAFGDGGAVVTSDPAIADRCRTIKQYGWRQRYISETTGMNTRLDEIQAAILGVKLKYLEAQNRRRQDIADCYARSGANDQIVHPAVAEGAEHVFHQYVVQSASRDLLQRHLQASGIGSAILYPVPVHQQAGYAKRVRIGEARLKTTETICSRILSIPVHPELNDAEIATVAMALAAFRPAQA